MMDRRSFITSLVMTLGATQLPAAASVLPIHLTPEVTVDPWLEFNSFDEILALLIAEFERIYECKILAHTVDYQWLSVIASQVWDQQEYMKLLCKWFTPGLA